MKPRAYYTECDKGFPTRYALTFFEFLNIKPKNVAKAILSPKPVIFTLVGRQVTKEVLKNKRKSMNLKKVTKVLTVPIINESSSERIDKLRDGLNFIYVKNFP